MWRYRDYLAVSEDFIPVFSEDVDKNHQENWKFFIPHAQMRDLLEKLIIALERGHGGDKRSLWLTGAYGTGKTFASFVIKHLLEDDLAAIEDYFQKHPILTPLWPRFKALRSGKPYLVVYRSASGHVTTNRRLMVEIQQAIKERLLAQGYKNTFAESIMDQLVNRLSDTSGIFNWEAAFQKYRGRFRTAASATEVIDRLRAGDVKMGELVADVLEEEGLVLVDSPPAVKRWIKEVIAANDLRGIVFIWDEFTEFFTNSVPVTPLQELAQATADMSFYLFLVTHRNINQISRIDDETRKRLLERFHNCQLEMTPVTAYKLIANVIEANPDRRSDWQAKRDSLWSNVDVTALYINLLGERVNKNDLQRLAPIHPMTAYLLSTLSALYSSSQRTLFQFMKTDEPGSFQWFIANYPKDNWYWLTPDFLWQYFFESIKIESIEAISDILTHYHSSRERLNGEDEVRVFRVMLLLAALERQTQGAHALLRSRLSILTRMFRGTDLFPRVREVADELCARDIMLTVPSDNDCEYIIPTATIDQTKLRQYRQRAENLLTFEKMIDTGKADAQFAPGLKEVLLLQGAAKLRHPVQIVSARDLKLRRERVLQGVENPYEIGLILVVAQEDEHLIDLENTAAELSRARTDYCILISQVAFGGKRWRDWLDYQARSWYHEEMKDSNTKRYYDTKAKSFVDEWLIAVRTGRVKAFFQGRQTNIDGCEVIAEYLEDIVASVYPYGPEKLSNIATLYTSAWGKAGAEIGLQVAQNIQRPYKDVVDELKSRGLWEDGAARRHGDHPLAKMQQVVDSFFATQDHVSLKQIWTSLQEPPYGLMPSPIGVLLFATLLRGYANGYYYSDGVNSLPLNPNKLAELIEQVLKKPGQFGNYTIRKMSPQGEEFCRMARDVFHLTADRAAYPEEARKNMRNTVIDLGYPLWTLTYYVSMNSRTVAVGDMARAIETLSNILTYDRGDLGDHELAEVVTAVRPVNAELGRLLSRDRMQEGMKHFWSVHAPELITLMEALHLDVPRIMSRLRALSAEDPYLWREERVQEKLPEVVRELDLVDALNRLCGVEKQDLIDLRNYFRGHWFKSKLPLLCFKEGQPVEVADLIDYLHEVVYGSGQGIKENRAEEIRRRSGQLAALFTSGPSVTGILVSQFTGQRLNDQEAAAVYAALPDLSMGETDEVRRTVIQALSNLTKQRKVTELRQRWRALTGSESPEDWSEKMRTPIHWVLQGDPHHNFILRFGNLSQLSETDIDAAVTYLTDHAVELSHLQDQAYVLNRFVQVAAGDYADLVRQAGAVEIVRDYIYEALQGHVYQWPMRLNEVNRLMRQWVNENYRATAYPRVLKAIEAISPDDMKRFVKDLAAEDALVGARLLTAIKKKREWAK